MKSVKLDFDRPNHAPSRDFALASTVVLLLGLGFVTLYSGSSGFAERFFGNPLYFVGKQAIFALVGLLAFLLAVWIPLDFLRKHMHILVIGAIVLCLLTFFPFIGLTRNGASRWIALGPLSFQPSELVKLILPIYLAHLFTKKQERLDDVSNTLLPPVIVTILFCSLIYLQNDFSTAAFIALVAFLLFFLSGVKLRHFFLVLILTVPLMFLLIFTREYRVMRLMSYIHPDSDPLGGGYQVNASIQSIASGGLWGKGLGLGTRKIASVPEIHSDFIFSAFSEESGFLGVILYLGVLVFFAWRVYRSVWLGGDAFRRLLACGLGSTIILQSLMNLGVVVGLLPATGIPLPFFSAGGSSLVVTLVMAGLLVNASALDARLPANASYREVFNG